MLQWTQLHKLNRYIQTDGVGGGTSGNIYLQHGPRDKVCRDQCTDRLGFVLPLQLQKTRLQEEESLWQAPK